MSNLINTLKAIQPHANEIVSALISLLSYIQDITEVIDPENGEDIIDLK